MSKNPDAFYFLDIFCSSYRHSLDSLPPTFQDLLTWDVCHYWSSPIILKQHPRQGWGYVSSNTPAELLGKSVLIIVSRAWMGSKVKTLSLCWWPHLLVFRRCIWSAYRVLSPALHTVMACWPVCLLLNFGSSQKAGILLTSSSYSQPGLGTSTK